MGLLVRLRSLWRGARHRNDLEAEMREEFDHHIELQTVALVRSGLSRKAARRQALLEFGHVESHREEARKSLGLPFLDQIRFSWLDVKLGLRMLVNYPGLTVMGGLAMAMGIAFGAGFFEFGSQWVNPTLSFDEDRRLVGIVVEDTQVRRLETRVLHDFVAWRESLRSVETLGAFRLVGRNLRTGEGPGEPVQVTEISPSAFGLTRTPPLLGRFLLEEDERPDAPPVVVIGYAVWRERFGAALDVVGRTVRLGATPTTVVGVMPEGYEFPHSQRIWTPLRLNPLEFSIGEGPGLYVFGRLASGVTVARAQAEVATLGIRANVATDAPGHLRVRVVPFPELVFLPVPGFFDPGFIYINVFSVALVVLFGANVALLLFARAAARETEFVVRNALGAGRSRIVLQLFVEALVLGGLAAVAGLIGARYGYEWFLTALEAAEGPQPFWFVPRISPATAIYAVGLTLLGAGVAGILPALKVTRGLAGALRKSSAGGGGLNFGGVWTMIIIAQVAVTVPLPAFAYFATNEMVDLRTLDSVIPTDEYLTARLEPEREVDVTGAGAGDPAGRETVQDSLFARYTATVAELERRLVAEPAVDGVTYASRLPFTYHPYHQVELDEGAIPPPDVRGHRVGTADVAVDYFDVFGAPILSGRGFDSEDLVSGARVVVVDQPFVNRVLGGANPLGRLVRYVAIERSGPVGPESPWYEIVGVVGGLGIENGYGRGGVYHPLARGSGYPTNIVVHLAAGSEDFASRLRTLAMEVDPTLRVENLMPLDGVPRAEAGLYAWGVSAIGLVTLLALMLSMAGIYAVLSYTVSRRTREIGIRTALGARATSLVRAVFRRSLLQVGLGICVGGILLLVSAEYMFGGLDTVDYWAAALASVIVTCVSLLACVMPTRRALQVQPMAALKQD